MSEHTQHQDVLTDLNPKHRALRKMIPDVYRGFAELSSAALTPGALDRKTKELIALAIGVVAECDGCIASHAPRGGPGGSHERGGGGSHRRHVSHARRAGQIGRRHPSSSDRICLSGSHLFGSPVDVLCRCTYLP